MTLLRMLLPHQELLRYRPECKVLFRRRLILVNRAAKHHGAVAAVSPAPGLAGAQRHRTRLRCAFLLGGRGIWMGGFYRRLIPWLFQLGEKKVCSPFDGLPRWS